MRRNHHHRLDETSEIKLRETLCNGTKQTTKQNKKRRKEQILTESMFSLNRILFSLEIHKELRKNPFDEMNQLTARDIFQTFHKEINPQ
jgi:uncharacterized protein YkuJ